MKTRSLWYTAPHELELREVEIPEPGPAEALVQVELCGVCTWDLFIFSGGFREQKPYPFYFGHEGIGRVVRTGEVVRRVRPGDRVALRESPEIGKPGTGHMAGHAVLPERMLIPLPETESPPERWLIEPVACCVNAIDRAGVRCGERVALVGCGFMGNILLQGLLATPASEVLALDVREELLARARCLPAAGHLRALSPDALGESGGADDGCYDLVVETSATEAGFRLADRLVRRGGRLLEFGWHHQAFPIELGRWHVKGVTVLNVSPATHPHFDDCFEQSIALIGSGRVDVAGLVTHPAHPAAAVEVFEKGLGKTDGYIKGAIRWSE